MISRALAWAVGRRDLSLNELESSKFVEEEQELSRRYVGFKMPQIVNNREVEWTVRYTSLNFTREFQTGHIDLQAIYIELFKL